MSHTDRKSATHYDNALHMMEVQGGSFVKALANCYYVADSANKARLRTSFFDCFGEYEQRFKDWKESKK